MKEQLGRTIQMVTALMCLQEYGPAVYYQEDMEIERLDEILNSMNPEKVVDSLLEMPEELGWQEDLYQMDELEKAAEAYRTENKKDEESEATSQAAWELMEMVLSNARENGML